MNYHEIDFNNIRISNFSMNKFMQNAYTVRINYYNPKTNRETKMIVQSDWIKLTQYAFAGLNRNPCYELMKIPLDEYQDSCVDLNKHLKLMDKWMISDEVRNLIDNKINDNKLNEYVYRPLVQKIRRSTSKQENFVKMKFNMDFCGPHRINKTMIIKMDDNDKRFIVNANTISEIADEITFFSDVKIYFHYTNIWVKKIMRSREYSYGIEIKIKAIEYIPRPDPKSCIIDFSSSDDDNCTENNCTENNCTENNCTENNCTENNCTENNCTVVNNCAENNSFYNCTVVNNYKMNNCAIIL